ncbi:alpha/beta hydrolase [Egicoccus halophilus]|uniref:Serine aminopeptidase S33 domain-containing protein n=1 Tax=Egicoccus halophilus TaxID=1670830 RepID=A0A8J3AD79_9ACTN|nr:alpha/beta hydrolase [Egicoccus halophilus]GGI09213.1 hypothetical protein GCM10011354_32960 [Egicoccus halophilus]
MSGPARTALVVLAALAALWLLLVLAAWFFQRQLIFLPDRTTPTPPAGVETVTLRTGDGLELSAWYLVPSEAPVATVLALPGNAGNRELRLPLAQGLVARGHAVLLVDYRGYGGNPGRPSEAGLLADARAARDHLEARDDVEPDRLVHLGESIGTGVAAALTAERPPAALVLRSPFPSLTEVGARHYPFLPVRWLLRDEFATGRHLAGWDGPTLVVAGDADTIVAPELSARVAEATDARRLWLPGVDHNDRALLDGDAYLDAVDAFVRDAVDGP